MQDMRLNTLHQPGNSFGRQVAIEPVHVDTSRLELPQGEDGEYLVVAVDDNPDVLQLITASLEQTPYRVVGVQDSTQAVAVIQELKPKAITLDIMMPKVNGWQILHQLKSNPTTASIPVVLLTVLEDRSAGYVLGADEYLVKPVARDALLSVLQQLTQKQPAALNMDGTTNKEGSGPLTTGTLVEPSLNSADVTEQRPVLLVHHEANIHQLIERLMHETGYHVQKTSEDVDMMSIIEQARPDLLMMLVNIDDSKVSVEQTSDDVIVDQASSPQLPPSVTPET
jgi:DNA-binding response OmpR family regulator